MQFIYTKGPYREYRGYAFCNGNPTTVTDRATETLLLINPDFRKVEDEKKVKETPKEVLGTITLASIKKAGRPRKVH